MQMILFLLDLFAVVKIDPGARSADMGVEIGTKTH